MWTDSIVGHTKLEDYVKTSHTLNIESLIVAEWNMNDFEEIAAYGTYKWRQLDSASSQYYNLPLQFILNDEGKYWTDGDQSFYTFADFVQDDDEPVLFQTQDVNRDLYFSLKDCFNLFRPRSGINKLLYFEGKYFDDIKTARRPRYYISSRYDNFKYWNSYRRKVENGITKEVGISQLSTTNVNVGYPIEDTAPFVVYNNPIPTNRIVVKMQTNLADSTSTRNIRNKDGETIQDPLQNRTNSSIPQRWRIEYLDPKSNTWIKAIDFNENSVRRDGSPIVKWDGYIELYYGVIVPEKFRPWFHLVDFLDNDSYLPVMGIQDGESYIVGMNTNSPGTLYVWDADISEWYSEVATYGFSLLEDDDTKRIGILRNLTNPKYYTPNGDAPVFSDLVFIKGLRIAVETMIAPNTPFDLIELSPRLKADISNYTVSFDFIKTIGDTNTELPVGTLLASNGNITIFNHDGSFTEGNQIIYENGNIINPSGSLISGYLKPNIKIDFYEAILNVDGYDKYIPIKSMYVDVMPIFPGGQEPVSVTLRDQFFKMETTTAPSIFLTDTSLTTAICILLDNIGFSNYIFLGFDEEYINDSLSITDPVIPYFYVEPDISVAEALIRLATSTQTAMFFDEYNNFVVMPKEWLLPNKGERTTNITLYGQEDGANLPNIISIDPSQTKILNDGKITYSIKYIQREVKYLSQKMYLDEDKTYVYKPVMLWEVGQDKEAKTFNESQKSGTGYALGAAALNSNLTASVPYVDYNPITNQRVIFNNIIDLGESVYWLPRFQGYLYANGEIIRYDAVEYDISGTGKIWISSNQDYQKYFITLPFNGKIYPTGNIRIYVEPFYEEQIGTYTGTTPPVVYKLGAVKKHGRGQFNTEITEHVAGLPPYWSDDANVRSCLMKSEYIFTTTPTEKITYTDGLLPFPNSASVGITSGLSTLSTRKGTIRNFLRNYKYDDSKPEEWKKLTSTGTLQSSALVFVGPTDDQFNSVTEIKPYEYETVPVTTWVPGGPCWVTTGYTQNEDGSVTPQQALYASCATPVTSNVTRKKATPSGYQDNGTYWYKTGVNNKRDVISYVYKKFDSAYKHFGTRMRIIGKLKSNNNEQAPNNATTYFNVQVDNANETVNISGGSGGIGIGINPNTNTGYYFEICSLTSDNLEKYKKVNKDTKEVTSVLHNIIFYKIVPASNGSTAIPKKLWGGLAKIIVDDGKFVGQDRIGIQESPTVYDIAVEYQDVNNVRRFYLYINNSLAAFVDDPDPLPIYTNACLFVRGSSEIMFENLYALQNVLSSNANATVVTEVRSDSQILSNLPSPFGAQEIRSSDVMRKYSLPGFIKSTYLTDVAAQTSSRYKMYYEEFGTIMRECAYFNIKYDQAYPAMMATIAATFNQERGYTVSGFSPNAYGAEFLIFNATDRAISLDEKTGNYLRILGVTFTQNITEELTIDDFFKEVSNFSDPLIINSEIRSPIAADKIYETVKRSRAKYGKQSFELQTPFIQSKDSAFKLMEWLSDKILRPRKVLTLNTFGLPHVQLGDIVTLNYYLPEETYFVDRTTQFVVSEINYSRSENGLSSTMKVIEV